MMNIENFTFLNSRGIQLAGRIYSENNNITSGVIFSHGLFSSKDGYKITSMAEDIVYCGLSLMTFDFTFSGESAGNIKDISIAEEVDDLMSAIEYFRNRGIKKIHLMGSSMGAAVTVLAASSGLFELESLILIATPLDFTTLVPGLKKENIPLLDQNGYTSISGISVNNRFVKELFEINMIEAVKKIKIPSLVIHGERDMVVDKSNLEIYIKNCRCESFPVLIEGGDHNLTDESFICIITDNIKRWFGKFIL